MTGLRPALLLVSIIALAACGGDEPPGEDAPAVIGTLAPTSTPRPVPTRTPVPTPTPLPTQTPVPGVALLVSLSQDEDGYLRVRAHTWFDLDRFDLDLFVNGSEYCNTSRMYADEEWYELGCEYEAKPHSSISKVSAQTPVGDLRCTRWNEESVEIISFFRCYWR